MKLIYSTFITLIVITISITIIITISIITSISKKRRRYFNFLLSLAYPIDRLDQALFTHVQCCDIVPSLVSSFGESLDTGLYFAPQLPRGFDHFYGAGRGGAGNPPLPTVRGGAGNPPLPAGRVPRGAGRPSLVCRLL